MGEPTTERGKAFRTFLTESSLDLGWDEYGEVIAEIEAAAAAAERERPFAWHCPECGTLVHSQYVRPTGPS